MYSFESIGEYCNTVAINRQPAYAKERIRSAEHIKLFKRERKQYGSQLNEWSTIWIRLLFEFLSTGLLKHRFPTTFSKHLAQKCRHHNNGFHASHYYSTDQPFPTTICSRPFLVAFGKMLWDRNFIEQQQQHMWMENTVVIARCLKVGQTRTNAPNRWVNQRTLLLQLNLHAQKSLFWSKKRGRQSAETLIGRSFFPNEDYQPLASMRSLNRAKKYRYGIRQ